jgi:hypothetical protein
MTFVRHLGSTVKIYGHKPKEAYKPKEKCKVLVAQLHLINALQGVPIRYQHQQIIVVQKQMVGAEFVGQVKMPKPYFPPDWSYARIIFPADFACQRPGGSQ